MAGAFVANRGTSSQTPVGVSVVTFTLGVTGIVAGNKAIVYVESDNIALTAVSVGGVAGTIDGAVASVSGNLARIHICSVDLPSGVGGGATVSLTFASNVSRVNASVEEWSGLATGAGIAAKSNTGTSQSFDTGAPASNAAIGDAVVACFSFAGAVTSAQWTAGTGFTQGQTLSAGASFIRYLLTEYQVAASAGAKNGTATTTQPSNAWAALVVLYRQQAPGALAANRGSTRDVLYTDSAYIKTTGAMAAGSKAIMAVVLEGTSVLQVWGAGIAWGRDASATDGSRTVELWSADIPTGGLPLGSVIQIQLNGRSRGHIASVDEWTGLAAGHPRSERVGGQSGNAGSTPNPTTISPPAIRQTQASGEVRIGAAAISQSVLDADLTAVTSPLAWTKNANLQPGSGLTSATLVTWYRVATSAGETDQGGVNITGAGYGLLSYAAVQADYLLIQPATPYYIVERDWRPADMGDPGLMNAYVRDALQYLHDSGSPRILRARVTSSGNSLPTIANNTWADVQMVTWGALVEGSTSDASLGIADPCSWQSGTPEGVLCKRAGRYLLVAQYGFASNATGRRAIRFYDGTNVLAQEEAQTPNGANPAWLSLVAEVQATLGTIIRLQGFQTSGGALGASSLATGIEHFVCAAFLG